MTKNKRFIVLASVIVIILLGLIGFVKFKDRNGVVVKSSTDYPVSSNIMSFRQDDDRWKEDTIGGSKYTMESSGCVITDLT